MPKIGIKGVIPKKNVNSSDLNDFFINSPYPNLKIMDQNPTWPKSVNIASDYNTTYTINHGLGYIPLYDLYFKDLNGKLIHIPGVSDDTHTTRAIVSSETKTSLVVLIGHPSGTSYSNTKYDVFHLIYIDPQEI